MKSAQTMVPSLTLLLDGLENVINFWFSWLEENNFLAFMGNYYFALRILMKLRVNRSHNSFVWLCFAPKARGHGNYRSCESQLVRRYRYEQGKAPQFYRGKTIHWSSIILKCVSWVIIYWSYISGSDWGIDERGWQQPRKCKDVFTHSNIIGIINNRHGIQ